MADEVHQGRPLAEFLPERWNVAADGTTLWISCFQMVYGDKDLLGPDGFASADLGDAFVLAIYGGLGYQYISPMKVKSSTPSRQLFLEPLTAEARRLDRDLYLLIVLPIELGGRSKDESEVRARVAEISAIATIRLGRNALFVHHYDNQLSLSKGQTLASTPAMKAPGAGAPRIDPGALEELRQLDEAIRALGTSTRDRLALALRWYDASFRSTEPIDDFLAAWFALEAADGSEDHVVGSVNRRLAAVYGISEQDAAAEFQVGKVFGLRGRIVHEGMRPAIHADLQDFVQQVFLDVVDHVLNQPPFGHARFSMSHATENPSKWLPNYVKRS